jgi:hypothetical protein
MLKWFSKTHLTAFTTTFRNSPLNLRACGNPQNPRVETLLFLRGHRPRDLPNVAPVNHRQYRRVERDAAVEREACACESAGEESEGTTRKCGGSATAAAADRMTVEAQRSWGRRTQGRVELASMCSSPDGGAGEGGHRAEGVGLTSMCPQERTHTDTHKHAFLARTLKQADVGGVR